MCPSYMATLEEKHTTRGRAHLLFEMLRGEVIGRNGWRDQAVKEALDLCLACKGCKGECPVQVDVATYKAEFLAHYYERRLRPRVAYALGLVPWWARLAERAPRVANALTAGSAGSLLRRAGGIAPERDLPRFADETFKAWFRRRDPRNPQGERVVLWPDTFTNHFRPQVGRAAVEVLEGKLDGWELPRLARKALVHGHCHHKALMKLDDEEAVLARLGLEFETIDSGCCGLAGSFGYEAGGHHHVPLKAGERVLLPAVRGAATETLIVADGFSCSEQIAHATGRRALHLAEVIRMALDEPRRGGEIATRWGRAKAQSARI